VLRPEAARWVDGRLTAAGLPPLPLEALAERAHAEGLVTGAVVHTFNRWQWAEADFELDGERVRLPLDGLALRRGRSGLPASRGALAAGGEALRGYEVVPRRRVYFPPTRRNGAGTVYYTPAAALVEVRVRPSSGVVQVLRHHTLLECGRTLVPELVSGQIQGGVAMGIGHALHEQLPLYEDGPGSGRWNLDRYVLPRARDVAVFSQTADVLPPLSESDPPKGMAEVTDITVIAAIANAVAHATGRRVRELPLTPERIREALA